MVTQAESSPQVDRSPLRCSPKAYILPDHLHAIFTLPASDADFSHRWRRIKTVFTQDALCAGESLGRRDGTGRSLWQRRFWEHTIRNDADFSQRVDYIHYNPTKHGLAASPSDWPYSSLHRFIRQGLVEPDWSGAPVVEGPASPKRDAGYGLCHNHRR
jgi:putative transposase